MKKIVLQINIEVNSGSTGRIAEHIGIVAQQHGFESIITYARGYNPSESKTIKIGNLLSIASHVIRTRVFGNHLYGSRLATLALIKKIKFINPDIIHLHQIHGYYLHVPILFNFLKEYNKPIVWTLHDCWAFTGHCTYFTISKCEKWKTECDACPKIQSYPKSLFIDASKAQYHLKKELFNAINHITFVGVSEWLVNLVKDSFLKQKKVMHIPNGINTQIFQPKEINTLLYQKYQLDSNKKYLICSGTTWIKAKGLDDYIQLSKILPPSIQIIIVGISNNLIASMPKEIICISRTESQQELAELYSLADILLCLSYQESFGMTPIEAMACGTPIVLYDNTALPELVDAQTGIVVKTGDVYAVKNAIEEILLLGKPHYSKHCIDRTKTCYDIQVTYNQYIQLYNHMLTQHAKNKIYAS